MIDIASRMTNGVKIPGRKATWAEIMRMFKNHLTTLKSQLNVCVLLLFCSFLIVLQGPTIQGEVSLTCDAWQAGNTDGYFAVTAHWTSGNLLLLPGCPELLWDAPVCPGIPQGIQGNSLPWTYPEQGWFFFPPSGQPILSRFPQVALGNPEIFINPVCSA